MQLQAACIVMLLTLNCCNLSFFSSVPLCNCIFVIYKIPKSVSWEIATEFLATSLKFRKPSFNTRASPLLLAAIKALKYDHCEG